MLQFVKYLNKKRNTQTKLMLIIENCCDSLTKMIYILLQFNIVKKLFSINEIIIYLLS